MKLSAYLDEKFILQDVNEKNVDKVICNVIEEISNCDEKVNLCKTRVLDALIKRERELSTAIGNGVGIPHARIEGYNDVSVVIVKLNNAIDEEIVATHKMDKVDLLFVIIAGKTKNKKVLKLMAAISNLAQNTEFLEKIRKEDNEKEIIRLVELYEKDIKDNITAEDIMCSEVYPAKPEDTLEEIAKRLIKENRAGLPVVDKNGTFLGEITEKELIAFGMPKYTSLMNDLSFMTIGEPFEEYFKNESIVTVKELFRKDVKTIDKKASIMEISFLIITNGNTRLYVVENNKYLGTVYRSDIIRKVLHI